MSDDHNTIDDLMLENRKFPPSAEFKRQALVADTSLYDEADRGLPGLLGHARPPICSTWSTEWDTICEWELPFAKWFVGGQLNVSYNCLDRHVEAGRATRSPSTGRASRATPARSPTPSCSTRCSASPTR